MNEWRTPTVVALCEAMRETEDYAALPILADALEEAGYQDAGTLVLMRATEDAMSAQRLVALAYSDETAAAVAKIEELAEEMGPRAFCEEGDGYGLAYPVDYARLMRVGDRWAILNDYTTEHGDEDLRSGGFNGMESFWRAYAAITGKHAEGNPFSCTC